MATGKFLRVQYIENCQVVAVAYNSALVCTSLVASYPGRQHASMGLGRLRLRAQLQLLVLLQQTAQSP